MRTLQRAFMALNGILILTALFWPGQALAHERRTVGTYQFVVGWIGEPAIEEQKNGVDLRVTKGDPAVPVEGLQTTLQVEITHVASGTAKTYPIRTIFRDPGHYTVDVIPTASGQYKMRFFGMVEGTQVNETFTSGPGRYGDIEPAATLYFPTAPASAASMQEELTAAKAEVASAKAAAESAKAAASSSRMLGIAGIVVGVLGLAAGGMALSRSSKKA